MPLPPVEAVGDIFVEAVGEDALLAERMPVDVELSESLTGTEALAVIPVPAVAGVFAAFDNGRIPLAERGMELVDVALPCCCCCEASFFDEASLPELLRDSKDGNRLPVLDEAAVGDAFGCGSLDGEEMLALPLSRACLAAVAAMMLSSFSSLSGGIAMLRARVLAVVASELTERVL